jgi:hypothetical protein
MATRADAADAAEGLRKLLAAIARGDLAATARFVARLEGAVCALDLMASASAPRPDAPVRTAYRRLL